MSCTPHVETGWPAHITLSADLTEAQGGVVSQACAPKNCSMASRESVDSFFSCEPFRPSRMGRCESDSTKMDTCGKDAHVVDATEDQAQPSAP